MIRFSLVARATLLRRILIGSVSSVIISSTIYHIRLAPVKWAKQLIPLLSSMLD
jgi:hypothetical protein